MSWRVRIRAQAGVRDLDVDLGGGLEPLALVGPNGSGKTTLLRVIAGAHAPLEGELEVAGRLLYSSAQRVDLPSERRRVGYVPQGYGLFPHLTVLDNVAFGLSTGGAKRSRGERRDAALHALDELDCAHLAGRLPERLSGGEKQRVALARALANVPTSCSRTSPPVTSTARRERH